MSRTIVCEGLFVGFVLGCWMFHFIAGTHSLQERRSPQKDLSWRTLQEGLAEHLADLAGSFSSAPRSEEAV